MTRLITSPSHLSAAARLALSLALLPLAWPGCALGSAHSGAPPAECVKSEECGEGEHCVDRRCVEFKEAGAPCSYNSDCLSPLVCNWGKGRFCAAASLPGETCNTGSDCLVGYTCTQSTCTCALNCEDGSSCGLDGCLPEHSLQAGEPCGYNANCAEGLACVWEGAPWVCEPPREVGDACGHDSDCASGRCDRQSHVCYNSCLQTSDCPDGESCFPYTLYNLQLEGACKTAPALGESCGLDLSCAAGLVCDNAYKCGLPVALGGACVFTRECAIGTSCVNHRCAPPPGEGEPCESSAWNSGHPSCAASLLCLPACVDGVCGDELFCGGRRAEGETCWCTGNEGCIGFYAVSQAGPVCAEGLVCPTTAPFVCTPE